MIRRGFFLAVWASLASFAAAAPVEFNRDVRPILSDNCFACHGPDKGQRKGGLRLDDRDNAIKKEAIVPGKPDASELVRRVLSDDETEVMPPPEAHKKLTAAQKDVLKRWVAEGAAYQPHWAYIAPTRPAVPTTPDAKWGRSPIDAFLFAAMSAKGVKPSPEADRRTQLRRLSLDLIGLPPTPEEVEAFVQDRDPRAFEKQVERLLKSPHYGERMAVPWLDLVRFADTVGYHGDQYQNVFPYRDYVIDSFNANKRFDVFTREQLAGDLLPKPTAEQLVATCFNRLNMMTREGGAQPKEYLAKYAADRVRTVSMTWLGSTMGCCECHDHKYDPFSAKDFYSLAAFFSDIRQWGVYNDYNYTPNPDLKGWSNDHPFPPEIQVASPYLRGKLARLKSAIADVAKSTSPNADAYAGWTAKMKAHLERHPDGWSVPPAEPTTSKGAVEVTAEDDGRIVLTGKAAKAGEIKLTLSPDPGWVASLRLEVLPHAKHKNKVTRDGANSALLSLTASVKSAGGRETKLAIAYAEADHAEPRFSNSAPILGVAGGWRTAAAYSGKPQYAVYALEQPVQIAEGDRIVVALKNDDAGCVRVSVSPFPADFSGSPQLSLDVDEPTYLRGTSWNKAAAGRAQALAKEIAECRGGQAYCQVTVAQKAAVTRVLPRGNWQDETGAVVSPAVPHFLPQPATKGDRLTRLDLADWLTSADNPLTARVFVNRLWKQLFGTGLSGVMEDVGAQGEWPSHPELLDWLAVEFRESGWDVKHMVRLMATSAAYRQESRARQELRDLDPNNRLVAFLSPRRLEAEFVRDNALRVAGLLSTDLGGPSVKPYQPAGYYANLQFPDRNYAAHADERQFRRGVYVHWQRTFLHPMLANFDAPSREECTASRTNANTPQQALTLLNDPTFVEAARVLAGRLLKEADGDAARLLRLYELTLARSPKPHEAKRLADFLAAQRSHYAANREDAKKLSRVGNAAPPHGHETELAAWANVCRVVLNLQETISRY